MLFIEKSLVYQGINNRTNLGNFVIPWFSFRSSDLIIVFIDEAGSGIENFTRTSFVSEYLLGKRTTKSPIVFKRSEHFVSGKN